MSGTPVDAALLAQAASVLVTYGRAGSRLMPLRGGLINHTWRVDTPGAAPAVLQCLHPVFAPDVNLNLDLVTTALARRGVTTPRLLRTVDGAAWVSREERHWRLLSLVDGRSVEVVDSPTRAAAAGGLLARFHAALADFTEPLPYVRPPVHEPARHFAALAEVQARLGGHRLAAAVADVAQAIVLAWSQLPAIPTTPPRLVHGDPKISNLLFDDAGRGLCLVDLDTLARAPLAYELGDAFRSWCNPGAEDAACASFSAPLFAAALEAYAATGRHFMTPDERAAVVPATAAIYLELAARFAADALDERYFGWDAARYPARGEHNLARARNQLAAAHDLLAQLAALTATAARLL